MSRSRSMSKSRSRSPVKRAASPSAEETTCPFLIRIFLTKGKHTPMLDFDDGKLPLRDEFQVYGWKNWTPTSLIQLLYPSFPPPYRSPFARFSFRHIYVDASQRGLYRSRDLVSFTGRDLLATVVPSDEHPKLDKDAMDMELDDIEAPSKRVGGRKVDEKTLDAYGFVTGDLLSVSLHVPEPKIGAGAGPGPGPRGNTAVTGAPVQSFGWADRDRPPHAGAAPATGGWGRGDPLPPQAARGGRGGFGRDEPAGGGSWRGGAPLRGGHSRRSRSPERETNGHRNGSRRSRSPDDRGARRESWASRRRD
ncbi:Sin3 associated polypeptide p18-domain-containing protein [Naematelia encephala]|uniref:Sin3 associated polypeptide p18-domain-containing protein n=1 Tax=Naematelia encephala TaxID=71784 RepID=A0A1Y2B7D3_9TREE|nr:Sin3 associated polypeptide p18-domain-containing protein [Naematelia encephala]